MKIIDTHENKTPSFVSGPTAITIGKFEALHLGHGSLIKTTVEYAKSHGFKSAVLSFVPHPAQILQSREYKPIYSKDEQIHLLKEYDIDYWVPYLFDKVLARKTADDFCKMLADTFNCKALLIGEGFRLGRDREGTAKLLKEICRELQIEVITVPHRKFINKKISTTLIRLHLTKAQISRANRLLGKPFFIMGTVKEGRQLGRTIGFPTANIQPSDYKFLPPDGVYAARVTVDGKEMMGIANIGTNPTITHDMRRRIETHIFKFSSDIYGKEIVVELLEFMRFEHKFNGLEELKEQISEDVKWVRDFIRSSKP